MLLEESKIYDLKVLFLDVQLRSDEQN